MSFEFLVEKIKTYTKEWNLSRLKALFNDKSMEINESHNLLIQNNSNNKNEIQTLRKNKEKVEAEIDMLQSQSAKKNQKFSAVRSNTFSVAKKVIDLEQEVSHAEIMLNEKQKEKHDLEKEVSDLASPTWDSLYNSFMKGLGVDFLEKEDGKIFARIKNREKQDVYMVEVNDDNLEEVREQIWSLL